MVVLAGQTQSHPLPSLHLLVLLRVQVSQTGWAWLLVLLHQRLVRVLPEEWV
jgi:hypothetical protein